MTPTTEPPNSEPSAHELWRSAAATIKGPLGLLPTIAPDPIGRRHRDFVRASN